MPLKVTGKLLESHWSSTSEHSESTFLLFGEEKDFHVVLPLHKDVSSLLELKPLLQDISGSFIHLDSPFNAGGVHPACNIDGVPPYVVIELCIANHSRGDVPIVDPNPEHKVKLYEALVEVVDTSLQGEGKLHQLHQVLVLVAVLLPYKGVQTRGSHECRSDGLDFLHIAKLGLIQQLIKVRNKLVQNPEKLFSAHVRLVVEFVEVD